MAYHHTLRNPGSVMLHPNQSVQVHIFEFSIIQLSKIPPESKSNQKIKTFLSKSLSTNQLWLASEKQFFRKNFLQSKLFSFQNVFFPKQLFCAGYKIHVIPNDSWWDFPLRSEKTFSFQWFFKRFSNYLFGRRNYMPKTYLEIYHELLQQKSLLLLNRV